MVVEKLGSGKEFAIARRGKQVEWTFLFPVSRKQTAAKTGLQQFGCTCASNIQLHNSISFPQLA